MLNFARFFKILRRRNFTEFSATFEILRRLNFTARNFGGIEFRGVNFNGMAMEFYRDAGFHAVSLAALRWWSFIAIQNFGAA
nr:hypothetical protein [uncultured Campylobacter sp.]